MSVTARMGEIRNAIGARKLVWFGTRGVDAQGLLPLGKLTLVVAQIAPLEDVKGRALRQDNLELRTRLRRDLDKYDIDADYDLEAQSLKQEFLAQIDAPVVLVAYRPHEFLSRPAFCLPDLVTATNFHLLQRQFEHKAWVERQMAMLPDVPVLKSTFIRDSDYEAIDRLLADGALVGRCTTGSGGAGVFTFASEDEYTERLPTHGDGFVGVAPFLKGAAPLNVNGCVYESGAVSVFGVSYQLIGVRNFTRRSFGFCGNDFAAASDLPAEAIAQIERATTSVGRWLHRMGYLGLFGLDLLFHEGQVHVIELNARFQASTPLSTRINQAAGWPDPMTEHVAAFLGLDAPTTPALEEQTKAAATMGSASPVAQVIHRNISSTRLRVLGERASRKSLAYLIEGAPEAGIHVDMEAMLFRSLHFGRITPNGYVVEGEPHDARQALELAVS